MQNFDWVPQGNTVLGVNRKIIEHLAKYEKNFQAVFDVPCGDGTFLLSIKKAFPDAKVKGIDLFAKPTSEAESFFSRASAKDWSTLQSNQQDVITCISGVMAFDDLSGTFEKAFLHLRPHGLFVVSNDNVLSVRDRLSFLFFGRVKRFKLAYNTTEGNWNFVLPQALWSLGSRNGFNLEKVEYLTPKFEDFFWMPIACLLYPLQWLSLMTQKSDMPKSERQMLFPLSSLWKRHYIMYFRKK